MSGVFFPMVPCVELWQLPKVETKPAFTGTDATVKAKPKAKRSTADFNNIEFCDPRVKTKPTLRSVISC